MRLPHLSKESRYLVGEGPSFSFQYSTSVLWLSEAELGFLKDNIFINWQRTKSQGERGFSKTRPFLIFLPVIQLIATSPENPYLFWYQNPGVTQLRERERRNLM